MSEYDEYHFPTSTPNQPTIRLQLTHCKRSATDAGAGRKPVLLLHGASANHGTFKIGDPGFAQWLCEREFDPWMLDWRGSSLVVADPDNRQSLCEFPFVYNFNRAAVEDLPAAIAEMRKRGVCGNISLLGHCMGSAVIAEAVALDKLRNANVDCVVHQALGLFYEAPIDSRLKSEERILERLTQQQDEPVLTIDPTIAKNGQLERAWPPDLTNLYDAWPPALRFHNEATPDRVNDLCNRLSFMYGMPYDHQNLVAAVHGSGSQKGELPEQFGGIPLRMYMHAARNLRRGHATYFRDDPLQKGHDGEFVSDGARAAYRNLGKVTLVTGALNRLWHRDSIDRMYEWLCRGSSSSFLKKFTKRVLPGYAHQDLLWGSSSADDVYPVLAEGLLRAST